MTVYVGSMYMYLYVHVVCMMHMCAWHICDMCSVCMCMMCIRMVYVMCICGGGGLYVCVVCVLCSCCVVELWGCGRRCEACTECVGMGPTCAEARSGKQMSF